ncbi:helix-turn-helix transcriptional regulator [Streptomyces chrestomyceticus]|uniref:Helix-turn-helix transcriptional regulator n=1 Tax=Streptomyces chrestomyceticus TaxID=68185 RepID=A0ABU7X8W4_9ACTN
MTSAVRRTCARCHKPLTYGGRGRPPQYCSRSCQRRRRPPAQAVQTGPRRVEALEAVHRATGSLLDAEYGDHPDLVHSLEVLLAVRQHLDVLDSLTVQQLRADGTRWETVAEAAGISESTARRKWGRAAARPKTTPAPPPAPAARAAAALPPQRGAPTSPPGPPPSAADDHGPPHPAPGLTSLQQFASALSHLQRSSGKVVRDIATAAGVSASYVSRVISGERLPSWSVARRITVACDGDPTALRTLWCAARGIAPSAKVTTEDAVGALHAALRGLYLSAGRPDPYLLHTQCQGALSEEQITDVFDGQYLPDWPVLGRLVLALEGRPDALHPLWNAAHPTPAAPPAPTRASYLALPVSAFG